MKLITIMSNSDFVLTLDEKPSNSNEPSQLCPLEGREQGRSLDQGDLQGSPVHSLTLMRGRLLVRPGPRYVGPTDERGSYWLCVYGLSASMGESPTEWTELLLSR